MKKRNLTLFTAFAAAAAFASTAQADITLQDGHTGAYRIAFNTTGKYTAASSTITEYDALVEAEAQGTSGAAIDISDITGWKVIGSTVGMNARVNTDTVGSGGANDVPIYNVNGVRIADGNAKFWNTTFGAYEEVPPDWTAPTPDDHLAFILHVNGNNPGYGNRTWTGTYAGGGTNTGNALGDASVGQADNRNVDAKWVTWGPAGNPNPNTQTYLLYGLSPVIGAPPVADPEITSITSVGGGTWQLTLEGEPDTGYEFRSSPTLEFDPGDLVDSLTQNDATNDPGTVTDSNLLTTDSNGDGKVRMMLTGNPADLTAAPRSTSRPGPG